MELIEQENGASQCLLKGGDYLIHGLGPYTNTAEEELGLRPNIGIRGMNPTRSTKTLLLEVVSGPARTSTSR